MEAVDVVCDFQTDKAVLSMESDEWCVLAKIIKIADPGSIKVGELIVLVDEDGEDWVGDAITDDASPVVAAPAAATGGSTPAQ